MVGLLVHLSVLQTRLGSGERVLRGCHRRGLLALCLPLQEAAVHLHRSFQVQALVKVLQLVVVYVVGVDVVGVADVVLRGLLHRLSNEISCQRRRNTEETKL